VGREIRSVYRGELGFKIADAVRAEINEQDGQSKEKQDIDSPQCSFSTSQSIGEIVEWLRARLAGREIDIWVSKGLGSDESGGAT